MKKQTFFSLLLILLVGFQLNAESISPAFFTKTNMLLKEYVQNGKVNYEALKGNKDLSSLIRTIADIDVNGATEAEKKAFYINAYNLLVINKVVEAYPLTSVQDKGGFFNQKELVLGGQNISLNDLEKNNLFKAFGDARLHFVLVCGAVGCPPITNFAYTPEKLEAQLEKQTKLAINDDSFISTTGNNTSLSQIFKWYAKDFGGSDTQIIQYINKYRSKALPVKASISYSKYDWKLNDTASDMGGTTNQAVNASRYIVSSVIPEGSIELKLFNNLYSQQTGDGESLQNRSTFFTSSLSALYGVSTRLNVGFATRYRRVRNDALPSSAFDVLGNSEAQSSRTGITAFGPQIRYAPIPQWENFSIQSSFVFAIGSDLDGNEGTGPYIDWDGATWNTQFFNDKALGDKFSLFTEIDLLIEDIGSGDDHANRISTPATLILSYTPTTKLIFYTIGGYSPYWQSEYDYFVQVGVGGKYQFTPNVELELLYTDFSNKFLNENGGKANTYNIGIRYNI